MRAVSAPTVTIASSMRFSRSVLLLRCSCITAVSPRRVLGFLRPGILLSKSFHIVRVLSEDQHTEDGDNEEAQSANEAPRQ